jgi:hypothetical protein
MIAWSGKQEPRNYIVTSTLIFPFASCILDSEVKKLVTQVHNGNSLLASQRRKRVAC